MLTVSQEEVKEILEIALDRELDEFSMDANWYTDYQMDSLAAVALVVEVQKRHGIRIPDGLMPEVLTGRQLKETVEKIAAMSPEERERLLEAQAEISKEDLEKIAVAQQAAGTSGGATASAGK